MSRRTRGGPSAPGAGSSALLGLGMTVAVVVLLVIPAVVMVVLPPRGTPTVLGDGAGLTLLTVVGVAVGSLVRALARRPVAAWVAAAILVVLAVWFQSGTWIHLRALPAPPILPAVAPTLTLTAGVVLAAAVLGRARDPGVGVRGLEGMTATSASGGALLRGSLVGAAVVAVVEADVWGRGLLRETFEGPWGLDRFRWLALLFVAVLVAGALVGWAAVTVRGWRVPVSGAGVVLLAIVVVTVAGRLGGPPRTTLYGLSLGLLAVAVLGRSSRA